VGSALVLWGGIDKDASPCDCVGGGGNRNTVISNKPSATYSVSSSQENGQSRLNPVRGARQVVSWVVCDVVNFAVLGSRDV
jgi:hypothetical protein